VRALLAVSLCFAAATPENGRYAQIDKLYLSRNQAGRLDRSIAKLESMLKVSPDDPQALWRLGRSLIRTGEAGAGKQAKIRVFTRAEELIGRSVQLEPKNAEAHFWHGIALGRRGEARGILRSLFMVRPMKRRMQSVLKLDPKHGGAHHVLGRMLYRLPRFAGGSKRGAVEELETALRLSPNYTANYTALADAYIAVGRKEQAREVLRAFFAVKEPSDPAVYEGHRAEVERMLAALRR